MGLQMDPFLSGIRHGRQESGDSGTSLSSNNYSMPHTPDFLGNMDDSMDCISGTFVAHSKLTALLISDHFNLSQNAESGAMESISSNLEATDDLLPSLQQVRSQRPIPINSTLRMFY